MAAHDQSIPPPLRCGDYRQKSKIRNPNEYNATMRIDWRQIFLWSARAIIVLYLMRLPSMPRPLIVPGEP